MDDEDRGQVNTSAADVYEAFFVPALFEPWARRVIEAAHLQEGQRVLDVACGTGIAARAAAERVGADSVVGLDVNAGMLAVAARQAPDIHWRQGPAEALPFEDGAFEAVVSQFGLMFFEDRQAALREMLRVLRPGGRLVIAVWGSLETSPGYVAMAGLLERLFGDAPARALRMPFNLGDVAELRRLLDAAGIPEAHIVTHPGEARFPSLEAWVFTEIKGWVLAGKLADGQYAELLREAQVDLAPFVTAEGEVAFSAPAHIATAIRI